jgi:hypothetical protein
LWINFDIKTFWVTFWAIFQKNPSGHPACMVRWTANVSFYDSSLGKYVLKFFILFAFGLGKKWEQFSGMSTLELHQHNFSGMRKIDFFPIIAPILVLGKYLSLCFHKYVLPMYIMRDMESVSAF